MHKQMTLQVTYEASCMEMIRDILERQTRIKPTQNLPNAIIDSWAILGLNHLTIGVHTLAGLLMALQQEA